MCVSLLLTVQYTVLLLRLLLSLNPLFYDDSISVCVLMKKNCTMKKLITEMITCFYPVCTEDESEEEEDTKKRASFIV